MSITKTNSEILNQLLNGDDLDAKTSNTNKDLVGSGFDTSN